MDRVKESGARGRPRGPVGLARGHILQCGLSARPLNPLSEEPVVAQIDAVRAGRIVDMEGWCRGLPLPVTAVLTEMVWREEEARRPTQQDDAPGEIPLWS